MNSKSNLDDVGLEANMNAGEEQVISDYLQNDLGCRDEEFYSLMEESKRLFKIIFHHDRRNKKSAGINREKILESVKYTAKNIINNKLDNYPWIMNRRVKSIKENPNNIS